MSETKICKQCQDNFEITDRDFDFYKRISPTFDGKTFEIPAPTICPACRAQRRLSHRNERNFYKNKSSLSQNNIISVYSPDKNLQVYSQEEWWSDIFDPFLFGKEYDRSQNFFDQYCELINRVPRIALMHRNSENCEYTNLCANNKNCYLLIESSNNEKCHYSYWMQFCNDCVDCAYCNNCEKCYEVINSKNCYDVKYSQDCADCKNSYFLNSCKGCSDCFGCINLRQKQYYIFNKSYTREEYFSEISKMNLSHKSSLDSIENKVNEFCKSHPRKYSEISNSENCTGCYISNSENLTECYNSHEASNCKYCVSILRNAKDNMDIDTAGANAELNYECINTAFDAYANCYCIRCWTCSNLFYCDNCDFCKNCFGCSGLRHKEYCILNKQYNKNEYELIVAAIIKKMISDQEWGEFLPISKSIFSYNETVANDYYQSTEESASQIGASWRKNDDTILQPENYYIPNSDISYYKSPEKQEELLAGIIKCNKTGKAFKIQPQELAFYIENSVPIPLRHYDARFSERLSKINPRKLYERGCINDGCQNRFMTTYSPERPEKVYCEKCYQEAVI